MREEGFVGEFAVHATGYLSPRSTVRVRACYGCHQTEVDEAYGEFRFSDTIGIRVGRFNVPFGGYAGRHNPSINVGNSKPLPYAMGLMPRGREFNQGVIPAPFVDTGVSLFGNLEASESLQLGFEAYAVAGLKGTSVDFDLTSTRDFEDNNGEPAVGARLVGNMEGVTLGASLAYGRYDPDHNLTYLMGGVEAQTSIGPFRLRGEYLYRKTEFLHPIVRR